MVEEKPTLHPESDGDTAADTAHDPQGEVERVDVIPAPPPPPDTKTPIQFNQQINVYQKIPQSAWDRLDSDQIVDLSKEVMRQADIVDERHYQFAMAQSARDASGKKLAMFVGGIITISGFSAATLLAYSGNTIAAISTALPLATVLAVVIGNRFLD